METTSAALPADCLSGGGAVGALLRARDWQKEPLGPARDWPAALQTAVRILLASQTPMFVLWGDDLITLYNDASLPLLGASHPHALAQPAACLPPNLAQLLAATARRVRSESRAVQLEHCELSIESEGETQRLACVMTLAPLVTDEGLSRGVFCTCSERGARGGRFNEAFLENAYLRVEAERALHVREEQLRLITDALPVLISYIDTEYRYQFANDTYRRWFGRDLDSIRGCHVSDVLGEAVWRAVQPHMERALAGEEVSYEQELRYLPGGARNVEVTYTPHRDAAGTVRGLAVLVTDISARRAAEQALRDSERMLAQAQRAAHVGSWELELGNDEDINANPLRWSDECYRVFGYEPGRVEVTNDLFFSAVHPDDREKTAAEVAAALREGDHYSVEHRIRLPDGSERIVQQWARISRDETGRPIRMAGTCQDITDRKRGEQEVRAAQEQLQLVMDTMPASVARCSKDRRFVWVNKRYAARLGYSPEEIRGLPIRDVLGAETYDHIAPYIDTVLSGRITEFEAGVDDPVGGRRYMHILYAPTFDAAGDADGWVAVISDITRRRELEQALRLSEERYRLLTEAITSIVWTTNAQGEFDEPQQSWQAYTGQSFEEHRGTGWLGAIHPDDRERVRALWSQACRTKTPYRADARVWHEPTGAYRFFEGRAVPLLRANGSVREWIGMYVDVHDRERAVVELRESARRKDEFVAMLAHELRNPLAPILNAVEILRLCGPPDPLLTQHREVIARQVHHMKHLLDDLLDVARVSQGKIQLRKEPLDLGTVLQQAVEVSRPLLTNKGQALALTIPGRPLELYGDPTRLTQVFANLLNNAAKYTDKGGHVRMEAVAEGDQALVRVRDDGIGMSPELLERVFELFTQADRSLDRSQGGLGIGLTMVQSLVQMHGGSVEARSDGLGKGSEFTVRLPLIPSDTISTVLEQHAAAPKVVRRLRVLIVDDNVDAAQSMSALLQVLGHETETVHDGPAAVEAALRTQPDLLLLDIGLPGMNGYEVARRLRESGLERTLIVAVTGYGRDEDIEASRAVGFNHHLVKPVDIAALQDIVSEAAPTA